MMLRIQSKLGRIQFLRNTIALGQCLQTQRNCMVFRTENPHVQNQLEKHAEPMNIEFLAAAACDVLCIQNVVKC